MEIEYSQEIKGKVFAYRFTETEKKAIVNGLHSEIKKLKYKIIRIDNNRYNEGQAKYSIRKEELRGAISSLESIINEFNL